MQKPDEIDVFWLDLARTWEVIKETWLQRVEMRMRHLSEIQRHWKQMPHVSLNSVYFIVCTVYKNNVFRIEKIQIYKKEYIYC